MTAILSGLITVALTVLGSPVEPAAGASALHYSVQFDPATGSAALECTSSSTGSCTFWVGDASSDRSSADRSGTLAVGESPVIVRSSAANPGYCAAPSDRVPPKWPECTRGPLGGALNSSTTVDYRWH